MSREAKLRCVGIPTAIYIIHPFLSVVFRPAPDIVLNNDYRRACVARSNPVNLIDER